MGTRLTVFNQKGGVGKTTTVLNLGAALAGRGALPLLVDLDAQSHLSSILNPGAASGESLYAYYNAGKPLKEVVRPVRFGGELIPGHTELIKVDSLFGRGPDILNKLKRGLDAGWDGRCPVLIDCCPMLGVLSLSGIFASERVLIPVSTDYLALRAALALENTLRALEHVLKRRVERRYLLTRFDSRRRMSHDIARKLASRYGGNCARRASRKRSASRRAPCSARTFSAMRPTAAGRRTTRACWRNCFPPDFSRR